MVGARYFTEVHRCGVRFMGSDADAKIEVEQWRCYKMTTCESKLSSISCTSDVSRKPSQYDASCRHLTLILAFIDHVGAR